MHFPSMHFTVQPIGWVRTGRDDPAHTDQWGGVVSTIEIDQRFGDQCLTGLDGFSHVEVVFVFHQATERDDYQTPRRPNRIGVSICRIITAAGRQLRLHDLDAIVGTPILDIKPAMRQFTPTDIRQPPWVDRLMRDYFTA